MIKQISTVFLYEDIIKNCPYDSKQDRYIGLWNVEDNSPNDV